MKYLLFSLFALISLNIEAQNVSISDLIKISKLNDSEIESFLNNKGCLIEKTVPSDLVETTKYYNYKESYWFGISNFKDGCKIVYLDFRNTIFYNFQKKEAIKQGFKYIKKEIQKQSTAVNGTKFDAIQYIYIKGKTKLSFFTNIFQTKVQYEISFSNCAD